MSTVSFCEHYSGAYSRYVRERRIAGPSSVAMFEMLQPAGDFSDPAVSDLVIIEVRSSISGQWDLGAGPIRSAEPGLIFVVPPECPTDIVIDQSHLIRVFAVPEPAMRPPSAESFGALSFDFTRLQHRGMRSQFMAGLLNRLWALGTDRTHYGRLLVESVSMTLLAELAREAGEPPMLLKGGLSPAQMRRVEDYIEAALGHDISLTDLAMTAGLSNFHFARSFKHATGMTPFQYLSKRRIARAQTLLETTEWSLVEIALACGFSSQASFTTAFGRETGLTPARWRCGVARA